MLSCDNIYTLSYFNIYYAFMTEEILFKGNTIIVYGLITFLFSTLLYPFYIRFLRRYKAGKTIREADVTGSDATIFHSLHQHKEGTPTMGWGFFLIMVAFMVWLSYIPYTLDWINNTLLNRQETYILLFGFFSMWLIGLVDDILNIRGHGKVKGLSARSKMFGMVFFSAFITYWFYGQLNVDWLLLRPGMKIDLWIWFVPFSFVFVLFVTHAINITDGLDGLAWGLMSMVLWTLAIITFFNQTYIATSLIVIVIAILISFLRYNINPAKIFMWDSGAFALWGLLSSLILLLNMREWIILPFIILFAIFIIELLSSFLQILSKKYLKRKLFPIAPLHHLCEYYGMKEYTVVMKFWMIQGVLSIVCVIIIIYIESFNLI